MMRDLLILTEGQRRDTDDTKLLSADDRMVVRRFSMIDVVKKASWRELALYLFGRRKAYLVEGDSMVPTLADGEKVLVDPKAYINTGDVILADHPYKTDVKVIKRVSEISDDGRLTLVGDNPTTSTDSRSFGTISAGSVIGKVTSRLASKS